jgi:Carboxypeptidase regulatory-like domain
MNTLHHEANSGKMAGLRLRCFLSSAFVLLALAWCDARAGYAQGSPCPALPEMSVSRLQGTVYGPSGVPVPQIQVKVLRDGIFVAQTQTDDKGKFEFKVAPGNLDLHLQFLGSRSMDLNVRVGHRMGLFHSAHLRIVLALSGARCSFATTNTKQFKNQIKRYQQRLEEAPTGP